MTFKRLGFSAALAATLVLASQTFDPASVAAQDCAGTPCEQVGSGIKGKVGLGLIGAEIGFVIPALAGLEEAWAYIVFPLIGAAGGAVAGHFLIDENFADGEGEIPVVVLAGGMALIVPTMVLTLALTAYDPGDDDEGDGDDSGDASFNEEFSVGGSTDDDGGGGEAEEAPPAGDGAALERRRRIARAGTGALRLSEDGLLLGVPGVSFVPVAHADATEVHLSLFTGAF